MTRLVLFGILVIAACSRPSSGTGLATPTVDTLPGGAVVVTNSGPTQWADTSGWRVVEERVIAPEAGSAGEMGDVMGVAMGEDGRVYVIQSRPHAIKVYAPDGGFERDIGRDGEGPGEFRVGYIAVRGDTIALQDPGLYRFTTFLNDGTLLQMRSSPGDWATSYLDIDRYGVVGIPGGISGVDGGHRSVMVRARLDGTVIDTIVLPEYPRSKVTWHATWPAGNMRIPGPLQPSLHLRYDANGRLVHGTTDKPELIVSRNGLDTLMIIRTTIPGVPISEAQRDSIFQDHLDGMEWQESWLVQGSRDDVPAAWPPWTSLNVDKEGNIWLGVPGDKGRAALAQVFNSDGTLLGTVPIPDAGIFSGTWGGDRIAVLGENDDGEPLVRVYRLVR
jgi:hypothetical protein